MPDNVETIEWAVKEISRRAHDLRLFQDYYRGEHRPAFATEKWETAFGHIFRVFRDNLCPAVVDTKSDRLQISGFDTGDDTTNARTRDIWQANRMDRRSGEVHTTALRDGDAFVIVWPGADGQPVFYPQRAERMAARWSEDKPGQLEVAAKMWPVEAWKPKSRWRLTLYYADHIERYITRNALDGERPDVPTKADSWEEYADEGAGVEDGVRGWNLPNQYEQVPVFAWNNNASTGEYGRSELADVVPLQDALNKTVADSLVAGEFAALPQRWATGLEVPVGPDGETLERPFEAGIDRIWTNANPQGGFGQFEPANMTGFVATADAYRAEIARVSRTPLHYLLLSGSFPSGEALRAAEAPLMAVVRDRQLSFGSPWEDSMRFAMKIAGVDIDACSVTWLDTTTVSESEKLDGLTKKQALGVPDHVLWQEMGYDHDQIEEFEEDATEKAEASARQFAGGTPTAQDLTGGGDVDAQLMQALAEAMGTNGA